MSRADLVALLSWLFALGVSWLVAHFISNDAGIWCLASIGTYTAYRALSRHDF